MISLLKTSGNLQTRAKPDKALNHTIKRKRITGNLLSRANGPADFVIKSTLAEFCPFEQSNQRISSSRANRTSGNSQPQTKRPTDSAIDRKKEPAEFCNLEQSDQRILPFAAKETVDFSNLEQTTSGFRNREQKDMDSPQLKLSAPRRFKNY
jgi:hypothetical protein